MGAASKDLERARLLVFQHKLIAAEQAARELQSRCHAAGDLQERAAAFRCVISAMVANEAAKEAAEQARQEFQRAEAAADKHGQAAGLLGLAEALTAEQKSDEALSKASEAEALLQELCDTRGLADLQLLMAATYISQNRPKAAINASLQAVELYSSTSDARGLAMAWLTIMRARLMLLKYEDALKAAEGALVHFLELQDEFGKAVTLLRIAEAHVANDQPTKALKAVKMAQDHFQSEDCHHWVRAAVDTHARALVASNFKAEALHRANEVHDELKRVGEMREAAICLSTVAYAHKSMGQMQQAAAALATAVEGFRDLGARRLLAEALQQAAELHIQIGQLDEARSFAEEALTLCRASGDFMGEAMATELLGAAHDAKAPFHRLAEAESDARRLIDSLRDALRSRNGPEFKKVLKACYEHEHVYTDDVGRVIRPVIAEDPEGAYQFFLENQPEDWQYVPPHPAEKKFDQAKSFDRRSLYHVFRKGAMGYGPSFRLMESDYRLGGPGLDSHAASALKLHDDHCEWEESVHFHAGLLDCILQANLVRYAD